MSDLPRPDLASLRWTTEDQWHITLRFLGEVEAPAAVADALREVPETLRQAEIDDVEAVLGAATAWFRGRQILHVPVTGLEALARAVATATAPWGEGTDDPSVLRPPDPGPGPAAPDGPGQPGRHPRQRRMDGRRRSPSCRPPSGPAGPATGWWPGSPWAWTLWSPEIRHEHLFANYSAVSQQGTDTTHFVWSAGSERRTGECTQRREARKWNVTRHSMWP